jgi:hypothetical protein
MYFQISDASISKAGREGRKEGRRKKGLTGGWREGGMFRDI